jgi:hypothetical protein
MVPVHEEGSRNYKSILQLNDPRLSKLYVKDSLHLKSFQTSHQNSKYLKLLTQNTFLVQNL